MESWLEPLYDAAGMRAIDAWAIEDQGVPSLELMEAAGSALAVAAGQAAGDGPIRRGLRQGQQRRRWARGRAPAP